MAHTGTITTPSWEDFKSRLLNDLYDVGCFIRGMYLFRGQASADWALESSFDRWFRGNANEKVNTSKRLLAHFREECESVDSMEGFLQDEVRALALAQHFGMPTRLLDWTESPYVAAFFAFCDSLWNDVACGDVAVWVLDARSPIWTKEMGVEIVKVTGAGNIRVRNQAGRFTYALTPFRTLEDFVSHCDWEGPALIKYCIPMEEARAALADLDAMGINHARVYPGLEGCARAAGMRVLM